MKLDQISDGQDSFLDVVANLVGIMIILIMVVGVHAGDVWRKNPEAETSTRRLAALTETLDRARTTAANLKLQNQELESKIRFERRLSQKLAGKRHAMLVQCEIARREIDRELTMLDQAAQQDLAAHRKIEELRQQIEHVKAERQAIAKNTLPLRAIIEHYPTPIAKTVFSDELHFRLSAGRLEHVPLDELVNLMKREWKIKAKKLERAESTMETVGPIGNFRLTYELSAANLSGNGPPNGRVQAVEFQRFSMQPVVDGIGEKASEALQKDSRFRRVIERHNPQKTTVSVWVYPDSFADFETIKAWLHKNEFQIASWPLEYGEEISGGPNGFRTTAN